MPGAGAGLISSSLSLKVLSLPLFLILPALGFCPVSNLWSVSWGSNRSATLQQELFTEQISSLKLDASGSEVV